jgi:hypothetical protein
LDLFDCSGKFNLRIPYFWVYVHVWNFREILISLQKSFPTTFLKTIVGCYSHLSRYWCSWPSDSLNPANPQLICRLPRVSRILSPSETSVG